MLKTMFKRVQRALGRAESHGEGRKAASPMDAPGHALEGDTDRPAIDEETRKTLERRRVQVEARVRALELEAAVMTRQTGRPKRHD